MEEKILLGETEIRIYDHSKELSSDVVFLNVHEDEQTSIDVLYEFSKKQPIHFFYLKHQKTRRITFVFENESFNIDPNRIFTKKGIKKTLKDGGRYKPKVRKIVKTFAHQILDRIPENSLVIAMHNNTDVNYSIKSYLPGGDEAKNTEKIHISENWDPDDFIYTTDSLLFETFKKADLNVILQDNKGFVNDGSLSVYCGKEGCRYINIEAQKGHFEEQLKLLQIVTEIIS